jgi:hypothetical protein
VGTQDSQLPKNLTISLPDELADAMDKHQEVNWSAVARDSIENYVKMRERPDLAEVVQQLVKERGTEYGTGVNFARSMVKKKGNAWLDVLVRNYNRIWLAEAEKTFNEEPEHYNSVGEVEFTDEFEGQLMYQALKKQDPSLMEQSDGFMLGFKATVLEIHEMVRKGVK